jgi:hypothetical protein
LGSLAETLKGFQMGSPSMVLEPPPAEVMWRGTLELDRVDPDLPDFREDPDFFFFVGFGSGCLASSSLRSSSNF